VVWWSQAVVVEAMKACLLRTFAEMQLLHPLAEMEWHAFSFE